LKEGLLSAKGIAIFFDADFVPQKFGSIKPSLILRSKIGVVQTVGDPEPQLFCIDKFRLLL
jgi:hypothetical protein